jgi:hypothetical protein
MFEIFSVPLKLIAGKHKGIKEGCGKYIRVIQEACSSGCFWRGWGGRCTQACKLFVIEA